MTLIKSISGIRGTIGGSAGDNLTPIDTVKYAAAFGQWVKEHSDNKTIIIGRDARISGEMISNLICNTLIGIGLDVINLGLSTTPTVEVAVQLEKAAGGIIITASHNPQQWNALKLLNEHGEFLSDIEGKKIIDFADKQDTIFSDVLSLGKIINKDGYIEKHIETILQLPLVNKDAIKSCNFKVAIDCVNSTGGIALPLLLKALGVEVIEEIYCEPTGHFPHNPEPLPEHLLEISTTIKSGTYDVGFVVDPDVDRLAIIDELGNCIGEEYTLVLIADYVLNHIPGSVVSNMSSSSALSVIAEKHGQLRYESAVGEVNVVTEMKKTNAIIGGEGNGGIIYPKSHYGRDSLVGIALFLSYLAEARQTVSELKNQAPQSYISKNKIDLSPIVDPAHVIEKLEARYSQYKMNTNDGLKVWFDTGWAQIRRSNTEPIIRIYTEGENKDIAEQIFNKVQSDIDRVLN